MKKEKSKIQKDLAEADPHQKFSDQKPRTLECHSETGRAFGGSSCGSSCVGLGQKASNRNR